MDGSYLLAGSAGGSSKKAGSGLSQTYAMPAVSLMEEASAVARKIYASVARQSQDTDAYRRSLMRRPVSLFFSKDRGMVFFLALLVLITVLVPMIELSRSGRLTLSLVFALILVSGAFATIRHRILIALVVVLTVATFALSAIAEFNPRDTSSVLETALKLVCLSILVCMTVRQTVRPGPVTVYRVMGGIAGYLLIGYTWAYAYQLVTERVPNAIHFTTGIADGPARQTMHLIYYSFVTLTTVGYGDVYPVHPAARSLSMTEALIGQLYIATMIASLVGRALQARSDAAARAEEYSPR